MIHIYRALRRLTFPIGFILFEIGFVGIAIAAFFVWALSGKSTADWLVDFVEGPGDKYWNWVKK